MKDVLPTKPALPCVGIARRLERLGDSFSISIAEWWLATKHVSQLLNSAGYCLELTKLKAGFLILLVSATCGAAEPGWKPRDHIEIVVAQGPGGGTDVNARVIQKILSDKRLIEVPITVVNKVGGGGSIGLDYLSKRPADGHTIMVGNTTLISSHIVGRSPFAYTDMTPIALLGQDYIAVAVRPDSPIKTGRDLLAKLKQDPSSVSISIGAAIGNQNHIAIATAAKSVGVDASKLKTVIFKSSSETVTSLVGGHVDVGVTSAGSFAQHFKRGTLQLIAVSAPKRLPGDLASVPTWQEQGVSSVIGIWYAVIGPKNMGRAQVDFWDGVFAKLVNTDEWKRYAVARYMSQEYLQSGDTEKFFRAQNESLKEIMMAIGLVK